MHETDNAMTSEIGPEALEELANYLLDRNVAKGFLWLDSLFARGVSVSPSSPCGIALLFSLSQWVDLGYVGGPTIESLLEGFLQVDQTRLTVSDFLRLRMVQAFCNLRAQRYERAIVLLDTTLGPGEELMSPYETFVAHFWMGRGQRLAGDFGKSLLHIRMASDIAKRLNAPRLMAVCKIHESWLVFHNGERDDAIRLLDEAEKELSPTGHGLSLANIFSARGRFFRSSGRYSEALEQFEQAIKTYQPYHSNHPNLARAYVNAAYIKRLMALAVLPNTRGAPAKAETHKLVLKITGEALALLANASEIYTKHSHQGGEGAIVINRGYLYLETGDIDRASQEGSLASRLGEEREDIVLMARACTLLASVEFANCEEQVEEHMEGRAHAVLAAHHADRAVALAVQTQNRRLQAAAYIIRGLIATDESSLNLDLARDYATRASQLLGDKDRDHLYRELSSLNLRILRSTTVDETVRAWCMGDLGGKSFQEVQERFAEIVIPRAWNRMDRKVSRVAQELSISPKKVRRILRNSKYL